MAQLERGTAYAKAPRPGQAARNIGRGVLDLATSPLGALGLDYDPTYEGANADKWNQFSQISDSIGTVAGGMALSAATMGIGNKIGGVAGKVVGGAMGDLIPREETMVDKSGVSVGKYGGSILRNAENPTMQWKHGGELLTSYNGNTHENGGIAISPTDEVEDKETSMNTKDGNKYIFSNSIEVPYKKNTTFAQASKRIESKYSRRLKGGDDKLATTAMNRELDSLSQQQEMVKEAMKTPEERAQEQMQLQQQMAMQQQQQPQQQMQPQEQMQMQPQQMGDGGYINAENNSMAGYMNEYAFGGKYNPDPNDKAIFVGDEGKYKYGGNIVPSTNDNYVPMQNSYDEGGYLNTMFALGGETLNANNIPSRFAEYGNNTSYIDNLATNNMYGNTINDYTTDNIPYIPTKEGYNNGVAATVYPPRLPASYSSLQKRDAIYPMEQRRKINSPVPQMISGQSTPTLMNPYGVTPGSTSTMFPTNKFNSYVNASNTDYNFGFGVPTPNINVPTVQTYKIDKSTDRGVPSNLPVNQSGQVKKNNTTENTGYKPAYGIPMAGYAAQALSNLPALFAKPAEVNYDRVKPEMIDLSSQRDEARRSRNLQYAMAQRNAGQMDNAGQAGAYSNAALSGISGAYGDAFNQSMLTQNITNTGYKNTANAQNAQIQIAEQNARQQEADAIRSGKQQAIANMGNSLAQAGKTYQQMGQDANMMNWLSISNPDYGIKGTSRGSNIKDWIFGNTTSPYKKPTKNKYGGSVDINKKYGREL